MGFLLPLLIRYFNLRLKNKTKRPSSLFNFNFSGMVYPRNTPKKQKRLCVSPPKNSFEDNPTCFTTLWPLWIPTSFKLTVFPFIERIKTQGNSLSHSRELTMLVSIRDTTWPRLSILPLQIGLKWAENASIIILSWGVTVFFAMTSWFAKWQQMPKNWLCRLVLFYKWEKKNLTSFTKLKNGNFNISFGFFETDLSVNYGILHAKWILVKELVYLFWTFHCRCLLLLQKSPSKIAVLSFLSSRVFFNKRFYVSGCCCLLQRHVGHGWTRKATT